MKKKTFTPRIPDVSVMEAGNTLTVQRMPEEEAVKLCKENFADKNPLYMASGFKECIESNDNFKSIIIAGPNSELCDTAITYVEENLEYLDSKAPNENSRNIWQNFVSEDEDDEEIDNSIETITIINYSDSDKKFIATGKDFLMPKGSGVHFGENDVLGINYSMDKVADKEVIDRFIHTAPECKRFYSIINYGNYKGDKKSLQRSLSMMAFQNDSEIIFIKMSKEEEMEYYRRLFITIIEKYGISIEGNFDLDRIIAFSKKSSPDRPGFMMEKLIKRTVRGKSGNLTISDTDFDFAEELVNDDSDDSSCEEREILKDYGLIGQEKAITSLNCICKSLNLNKKRADKGIDNPDIHNVFIFEGPPGTGKTTAAKRLAKRLFRLGVIKDSKYIQVNGAELKGEYQGHSVPKVKKIFEKNSVVFIDEAYSLMAGDGRDTFSNEVMSQLLIEIENLPSDKVVIFAGYGGENVEEKDNFMKKFIDANPGLSSRISNVVYFEPYDEETMVCICHKLAEASNYLLGDEADEIIKLHFSERVGNSNFGNGREARRLIENAIRAMADRLLPDDSGNNKSVEISEADLKTILKCDIEKAIEQENRINNCTKSKKKQLGFV